MDILVGTAAGIQVDFSHPTGMKIPTPGSVTYSLYDHTGAVLVTGQALSPATNATGVSVSVDASNNTITDGRSFEKRILIVSWQNAGQSYLTTVAYRVVPLTLFTATASKVRALLGYAEDELRDDEVDLFEAYLQLKSELQDGVLDAALVSGTATETRANEAITLQAAVAILPSLRLRTLKENSSGTDTFSRFATTPDFDTLEALILSRLDGMKSELGLPIVTVVSSTFLLLTSPTDPITGV